MDSILQVKEQLVARSRTASLDDLKSQGRRLVKVIRAEHIAAMIQASVEKALEGSDMMSREEVDQLVERSRREFKHVMEERQQELAESKRVADELSETAARCAELETALERAAKQREALAAELDEARSAPAEGADPEVVQRLTEERDRAVADLSKLRGERDGAVHATDRLRGEGEELRARFRTAESELQRALAEVESLRGELEASRQQAPAAAAGNADLMMRLMQEVADLKAQASGAPSAAGGSDEAVAALLGKLAGSIDERFDKLGRKLGMSSAVEVDDVKLDGLFGAGRDLELESNMDSVQARTKGAGGIASNLERLKRLKGDG